MDRTEGSNFINIGGGRRGFQDQNAEAGVPGTRVTADHLNAIQEEILAVIENAGILPDKANWKQLDDAIRKLTTKIVNDYNIPLAQLNCLPWLPVISLTTKKPPAKPAVGDMYVVPEGGNGEWSNKAGQIAEWNGKNWTFIQPQCGHGIGLPDGRVFIRIIDQYIELKATTERAGLVELATIEETAAKKDNERAVTPLGLATIISKIGYQTIVFKDVGSTTWTVPEGVGTIDAQVWGAGGGGGGSYKAGASGGGGGGYIDCKGIQVTPGQKIIVTVGAGGAGGSAAPTNGGAGGASSVGNYATAYGGGGGIAANGVSTLLRASGGKAIGNGLAVPGQDSQTAIAINSNYFMGGQGGGAYGTTNSIVSTSVRGADGAYPAGGGCGDPNGFGGGKGANGLVAISFIKDSTI